jgi:hypothetical protein
MPVPHTHVGSKCTYGNKTTMGWIGTPLNSDQIRSDQIRPEHTVQRHEGSLVGLSSHGTAAVRGADSAPGRNAPGLNDMSALPFFVVASGKSSVLCRAGPGGETITGVAQQP